MRQKSITRRGQEREWWRKPRRENDRFMHLYTVKWDGVYHRMQSSVGIERLCVRCIHVHSPQMPMSTAISAVLRRMLDYWSLTNLRRGVIISDHWRIGKFGESGTKQVILKYCRCMTYCRTPQRWLRSRSGEIALLPFYGFITAPSCHRYSFAHFIPAPWNHHHHFSWFWDLLFCLIRFWFGIQMRFGSQFHILQIGELSSFLKSLGHKSIIMALNRINLDGKRKTADRRIPSDSERPWVSATVYRRIKLTERWFFFEYSRNVLSLAQTHFVFG